MDGRWGRGRERGGGESWDTEQGEEREREKEQKGYFWRTRAAIKMARKEKEQE